MRQNLLMSSSRQNQRMQTDHRKSMTMKRHFAYDDNVKNTGKDFSVIGTMAVLLCLLMVVVLYWKWLGHGWEGEPLGLFRWTIKCFGCTFDWIQSCETATTSCMRAFQALP